MVEIPTGLQSQTGHRPAIQGGDTVFRLGAAQPEARAAGVVRLGCTQCRSAFLLDLDEEWSVAPGEAEVVGRQFVGIGEDAPLCPRCLDGVKLAGAERLYWRLAEG